jgi:hypothetical protein
VILEPFFGTGSVSIFLSRTFSAWLFMGTYNKGIDFHFLSDLYVGTWPLNTGTVPIPRLRCIPLPVDTSVVSPGSDRH